MERDEQQKEVELMVDLGSVTAETKGPGFQANDIMGQLNAAGLGDE